MMVTVVVIVPMNSTPSNSTALINPFQVVQLFQKYSYPLVKHI